MKNLPTPWRRTTGKSCHDLAGYPHIWVWWVDDNQQLEDRPRHLIQDNVRSGLEVGAISCWEVATLVQYGR
jgi:PIN domain nuclease of toxin-antitoxin system